MDGTAHRSGTRQRQASRRLVLAELADRNPVSQADLIRRTGLARATVAAVVTDLIAEGTLSEVEGVAGRPGRPARQVRLTPPAGIVAAVDFGHAHLAIALADQSDHILGELEEPLDVDPSPAAALDRAAQLLAGLRDRTGIDRPVDLVVLGVPGPVDSRTGRLRAGTMLPAWTGWRPGEVLSTRIGLPVLVDNDANLGALGEHVYGAGRGRANLLYIKVSSGIGAGIILDGRLYRGSRGTAGEIGHIQVQENGPLCRCGSRGCLETLSSAGAALRLMRAAEHHADLDLAGVQRLLRRGDPGATRLFEDMGMTIGRVAAAMAANLDPELIVVGGPLVTDPGPLVTGMAAAVRRYTQPYVSDQLPVVGGTLGHRAGLLGAIALGLQAAAEPGRLRAVQPGRLQTAEPARAQ